jgi:hypothetical protein
MAVIDALRISKEQVRIRHQRQPSQDIQRFPQLESFHSATLVSGCNARR